MRLAILIALLTAGCSVEVCTTWLIDPSHFGITAPTSSCAKK